MNILKFKKRFFAGLSSAGWVFSKERLGNLEVHLVFGSLLLLWPVVQRLVSHDDPSMGYIGPSIWLLILMSLISFFLIVGLCWWLMQRFWLAMGLPGLDVMVVRFKDLLLWQQLGFYFLAFASLLFTAVICLNAIC